MATTSRTARNPEGTERGGVSWRIALLLGVLLAAAPVAGWAHASLIKSSPARRAVLIRPPGLVQLRFSERLEPRFSHVSVWD